MGHCGARVTSTVSLLFMNVAFDRRVASNTHMVRNRWPYTDRAMSVGQIRRCGARRKMILHLSNHENMDQCSRITS